MCTVCHTHTHTNAHTHTTHTHTHTHTQIHTGVTADPQFIGWKIRQGQDFALILASDGVWNALGNENVVQIVAPYRASQDAQGAAEAVVAASRQVRRHVSTPHPYVRCRFCFYGDGPGREEAGVALAGCGMFSGTQSGAPGRVRCSRPATCGPAISLAPKLTTVCFLVAAGVGGERQGPHRRHHCCRPLPRPVTPLPIPVIQPPCCYRATLARR